VRAVTVDRSCVDCIHVVKFGVGKLRQHSVYCYSEELGKSYDLFLLYPADFCHTLSQLDVSDRSNGSSV